MNCMRAGIERELSSRADKRVLRWFGHVQRMDEYRMARTVLIAEVSGGRVRGRQRLGWMDGVNDHLATLLNETLPAVLLIVVCWWADLIAVWPLSREFAAHCAVFY